MVGGIVRSSSQVESKNIEGTIITEYFTDECPNLGLAVAQIDGEYPKDKWACNQGVDEMYYVMQGNGNIIFEGQGTWELVPGTAVLIPKGTRFYVKGSVKLVVPTSPAWTREQHKWYPRA